MKHTFLKHSLLKHALWTALLVAGAALAQNAAISGADFTHGKADAQLAAIGGKAAADGRTVVVTAPTYWQAKVAAKIRSGAHGKPVTIRFSNGFYEIVLVRTEAAAPAEAAAAAQPEPAAKPAVRPQPKAVAKAEPRAKPKAKVSRPEARVAKAEPKPAAEPRPESKPVTRPVVAAAPAPQPAGPVHTATPEATPAPVQQAPASISPAPAPKAADNIVAVPQVSHQPAVVPIPTTAINATGVRPSVPGSPANAETSARRRLLASLANGRPAMGSLTEAELQPGDQVYSDGDTLAVVRLEGLHRSLYWLQGPVDLQRVQYLPQANGSYQVTGTIDPRGPAAHRSAGGARVIVTDVPATGSTERARLERQYNNGQPIIGSLTATRLQPEDRLLVNGSTIVVARREGNSMARYWLTGSIDLGQTGIQKLDGNVYRVTGNSLH
jgi:hypothetical protein